MTQQHWGAFFLILLIGAAAWWYQSTSRASVVASIKPDDSSESAGNITPSVPLSNVETNDNGNAWFPYYLVSNYPSERGGNDVVPSTVVGGMAEYFGPQQIIPQL